MVTVIVASTLGFSVKEYFENKEDSSDTSLSKGSNYDPFGTGENRKTTSKNSTSKSGSDTGFTKDSYQSIIADLEDNVIADRKQRKRATDLDNDIDGGAINLEDSIAAETDVASSSSNNFPDMSRYILKSEVVPPVCPKCPDSRSCPRPKPCPACPPCARCPEPAFECKKVPNYNAISASNINDVLPMPRLNSFSQFN